MSHRSRVSNPSLRSPASREVTSDSVELCETEVCFLLIQLTETPPEVDFDSSRAPENFVSLEIIQVCSAVLYFLHDNIDDSHSCDEYMMKSALLIGCDMLESIFKTDLTSFFTDHQISGRPIRAKYKHFETMCGQTSDNSPTDSSSSCLKWLSSKQGCETLQSCFLFFVCQFAVSFNAFFEHVLPCRRTTILFVREVFAIRVIFCCSSRNT